MLDWSAIDTVLLDMDGTLLDLHFDNYFWLQHLPKRYSEISGISAGRRQSYAQSRIRCAAGQTGVVLSGLLGQTSAIADH